MINQHQFQQSARHFRSGRISLSEFQARVFAGAETKPHETNSAPTAQPLTISPQNPIVGDDQQQTGDVEIMRGETLTILTDVVNRLIDSGRPTTVTGVSETIGLELSRQITTGKFNQKNCTFVCGTHLTGDDTKDKLAIVAVVQCDDSWKTGLLAAVVESQEK